MKIQIVLFTDFGHFYGEIVEVSEYQYQNIISLSKSYYETGFEMNTEDGGFVIIPPDMTKRSVFKINKISDV